MHLEIINIRVTDLPNCGHIGDFIELLSRHRSRPPTVESVIAERITANILMAISQGRVIGILRYCIMEPGMRYYDIAPGATYINMVHVHSDWRRKGVAKMLLGQLSGRRILDVSKENLPAVSLYKSIGFTIIDNNDRDYIMSTGESSAPASI